VKRMRWGLWSGEVSEALEDKDFEVAFGGHGKSWSVSTVRTTTHLQFRSVADKDAFLGSYEPDKIESFELGHGTGTASRQLSSETRFADGTKEHKESNDSLGAEVSGSLRLAGGEKGPRYDLAIASKDSPGKEHVGYNFDGSACADGGMMGQREAEGGRKGTDIYWHRTTTWSFHLDGSEKPRHVGIAEKLPNGEAVADGFRNYWRLAQQKLQPAVARLVADRKYEESVRLSGILETAYKDYEDRERRVVQDAWKKLSGLYVQLSGLWVSNAPEADAEYGQKLGELQGAIAEWQAAKASTEQSWEQATEQAAKAAQDLAPQAAQDLRELGQKLKAGGTEAFGSP
jgi:hypothetical protein